MGIDPNTDLSKSSRLEVDSVLGGYKVNAELQACTDVWVVCSTSLHNINYACTI